MCWCCCAWCLVRSIGNEDDFGTRIDYVVDAESRFEAMLGMASSLLRRAIACLTVNASECK